MMDEITRDIMDTEKWFRSHCGECKKCEIKFPSLWWILVFALLLGFLKLIQDDIVAQVVGRLF